VELAVALKTLWNASAPQEGLRRLTALLERAASIPPTLRARALRVQAGTADLSGQDELAQRLWNESLDLYTTLGDDRGTATVEHMLAVSAWRSGDLERMRELTESSLARARGRFPFVEISGYWLLGQVRLAAGDVEEATELTRRSAEMAREIGWHWWESGQLHELLMLALRRGELDEAEREGRAALLLEREQENRLWATYTIAGLARVALARDDLERAGLLWGAVDAEAEALPRWQGERELRGGELVKEARPEFLAAFARGREIDLWHAAAIALGEEDDPQTVP
jgi:ATP/maltotriose-dependent transcriptional regulator MalT